MSWAASVSGSAAVWGWPPMVVICWIGRSARTTFLMLEAYRALGAAVVGDLLDTAGRHPPDSWRRSDPSQRAGTIYARRFGRAESASRVEGSRGGLLEWGRVSDSRLFHPIPPRSTTLGLRRSPRRSPGGTTLRTIDGHLLRGTRQSPWNIPAQVPS